MTRKGDKHTEETRQKMSLAHIGKHHTEEHKRKIGLANIGKHLTEEHKQTISLTHTGMHHTEEAKQKIRLASIGRRHTEEARQKISLARKGHIVSEKTRQKISLAHTGKHLTEEHKQKLSLAHIGNHITEETKQKLRERWQDPNYFARQVIQHQIVPNRDEVHLQKLLDKWYPYEWEFVGDGKLVIDGICPDFVCINGKKQLIELDGEYWHRDKDSQKRIDRFAKFGFYCLVIQDNELKNEAILHKKVNDFIDSYPHKLGLAHKCYHSLRRLGLHFRKTNCLDGESTSSIRMKRLWQDPEFRQKQTGKHHTEETKRKISIALKDRALPEETKQKMRECWRNPTYREKMSLAHTGKHFTEEHKRKIGLVHKGKIVSGETRQKMSVARKAYYTNKRKGVKK